MDEGENGCEFVYEIRNLSEILNQASIDDWREMWKCMRYTVEDVILGDDEGDDSAEIFLANLTVFAVRYQKIINRMCSVADVTLVEESEDG